MEGVYFYKIKPVDSLHFRTGIFTGFFGRNDAKAETPILWPPHAKCWLIGKDSDVGRDWRQEEKGKTEDEMAGWHHWLNGRESGWTPGDGDGQRGLACCDSWGHKESDTTEQLNWTELKRTKLCVNSSKNCCHLFADTYVSYLMLDFCTYITLFNSHKNHRGKSLPLCFKIEGSATQKCYVTAGWRIKLWSTDSFHCLSKDGHYCLYLK